MRRSTLIIIVVAIVLVAAAAVVAIFVTNDINNKKAIGIEITTYPVNLEYFKYDQLDLTGLTVKLRKNSAQYDEMLDVSKLTITGFDSSKVADRQTVTISYEGFTATFVVKIKELPAPKPAVTNIKLEMDEGYSLKTKYNVGETLELTNMYLLVTYSDGSTAKVYVTIDMVSGFDSRRPATEQRVKITHGGLFTTFYVDILG